MDWVGKFWRGEITSRMLENLIRWLPEDSALHRAMAENHLWTTETQIMWQMLHMLARIDTAWNAYLTGAKKIEYPKWTQFPWDKPQGRDGVQRYGQVDEADREAAIRYLIGLNQSTSADEQ